MKKICFGNLYEVSCQEAKRLDLFQGSGPLASISAHYRRMDWQEQSLIMMVMCLLVNVSSSGLCLLLIGMNLGGGKGGMHEFIVLYRHHMITPSKGDDPHGSLTLFTEKWPVVKPLNPIILGLIPAV